DVMVGASPDAGRPSTGSLVGVEASRSPVIGPLGRVDGAASRSRLVSVRLPPSRPPLADSLRRSPLPPSSDGERVLRSADPVAFLPPQLDAAKQPKRAITMRLTCIRDHTHTSELA